MGKICCFLFCLGFAFFSSGQRMSVYTALKDGSKEALLKELNKINTVKELQIQKGYEGALNCKIANFETTPFDKLSYFKKGALLIESAIKAEPNNIELHFLRLMIQENAPSIVRYNSEIQKDTKLIKEGMKSITTELKSIIFDYSKSSKYLHL